MWIKTECITSLKDLPIHVFFSNKKNISLKFSDTDDIDLKMPFNPFMPVVTKTILVISLLLKHFPEKFEGRNVAHKPSSNIL